MNRTKKEEQLLLDDRKSKLSDIVGLGMMELEREYVANINIPIILLMDKEIDKHFGKYHSIRYEIYKRMPMVRFR
jgi:hypothetical protein